MNDFEIDFIERRLRSHAVNSTVPTNRELRRAAECVAELHSELSTTRIVRDAYAATVNKFAALVPVGVTIEQLVATYNAQAVRDARAKAVENDYLNMRTRER